MLRGVITGDGHEETFNSTLFWPVLGIESRAPEQNMPDSCYTRDTGHKLPCRGALEARKQYTPNTQHLGNCNSVSAARSTWRGENILLRNIEGTRYDV